MAAKLRKTFKEILREEAPRSAWKLETKARHASSLAKIQPECSSELYAIKHAALRQLFRIPAHAPVIRNAWTTARGFLLSVELDRTGSRLHVPLAALNVSTQQTHTVRVMRRNASREADDGHAFYPDGGMPRGLHATQLPPSLPNSRHC